MPPRAHGGVETLLAVLCAGMLDRGDDVVVYSVGTSSPPGECRWLYAEEQEGLLASPQRVIAESAHSLFAYEAIARDDVDVIHDHSGYVGPSLAALAAAAPVLFTPHKPITDLSRRLYGLVDRSPRVFFSAISDHQRRALAGLKVVATVHNAIDTRRYPLVRHKQDYLVDIGRICAEKAPHRAIEVARRVGLPLRLAGRIEQTPVGQRYFAERIEPELGDGIEFLGEVGFDKKVELIAHARALVFPVAWAEPFGLVVAEALACGTPVIASPRGGIPEIIRDGVDGFLTDDGEQMVEAVGMLGAIDPDACRHRIDESFSAPVMAEGYARAYETIIARALSGLDLR